MTERTIPCRVCGKLFVPCNKTSSALGAFNYHSVACSPECGAEYLRRVQEARNKTSTSSDVIVSKDNKKKNDKVVPKRSRGRRKLINPVDEYSGES